MNTVLDKATRADIRLKPFPHLVIRDALDSSLCERLIREYPKTDLVAQTKSWRSNQRFSLPSRLVRNDAAISQCWREFVEAHVRRGFLDRVFALFGDEVLRRYPQWASSSVELSKKRLGRREVDDFDHVDVLLDALPSVNTPVTGRAGSVRTAHVDDPRKLVAGLFYLRRPEDDSRGGALVMYRYRDSSRFRFENQMIDERFVEQVETVPYASNVLVMFVNSLESLHGVTPRYPTGHDRIFMNIIADTERPLFALRSHQYSRWQKKLRRLKRSIMGTPAGFNK